MTSSFSGNQSGTGSSDVNPNESGGFARQGGLVISADFQHKVIGDDVMAVLEQTLAPQMFAVVKGQADTINAGERPDGNREFMRTELANNLGSIADHNNHPDMTDDMRSILRQTADSLSAPEV